MCSCHKERRGTRSFVLQRQHRPFWVKAGLFSSRRACRMVPYKIWTPGVGTQSWMGPFRSGKDLLGQERIHPWQDQCLTKVNIGIFLHLGCMRSSEMSLFERKKLRVCGIPKCRNLLLVRNNNRLKWLIFVSQELVKWPTTLPIFPKWDNWPW